MALILFVRSHFTIIIKSLILDLNLQFGSLTAKKL